ncbi:Cell division control protein 25 [Candida viswanathii]|uniref:Cell division control protein 25 n=1 Tax=Candida viswanathii TaxID=5486 RepID=A0A367YJ06_9ASCO|nr:Cell division control protein 25 [Candida viswanathii]
MNYPVDEVPPDVISPHDSKPTRDEPLKHLDTVIALYDFPGTQPSHLPLNLGDTVHVLSKSATGWWDGVVMTSSGELQRGWFPHNYVRSVNYVQPVLNKLKDNKELDSITAANTAANVVMPSLTNLIQRSLQESERNSPLNSTRKNSVVSFASSETSMPSDSKLNLQQPQQQGQQLQSLQQQPLQQSLHHHHHHFPHPQQQQLNLNASPEAGHRTPGEQNDVELEPASQQPSISHTLTGFESGDDEIAPVELEDAERLASDYRHQHNKTVTWIPRKTTTGDIIFYCEQLDIYCESLPLISFDPESTLPNLEYPKGDTIMDATVVPVQGSRSMDNILGQREGSTAGSFDPLKRDSNVSVNTQSSGSSYHRFNRPFFSTEKLFYKHTSDVSTWSKLKEDCNYILDLMLKALKDQNRQLFSTHFTRLNKLVVLIYGAARLNQDDYVDTKYEASAKRKLKRICASFSQIYINGILHLSVLHYALDELNDSGHFFGYDMSRLNKSNASSTFQSPASSMSTIRQGSDDSFRISQKLAAAAVAAGRKDLGDDSNYKTQLNYEIENLRANTNSLVKIFLKLSRDKKIRNADYDSSDASEDEGEDRYDILPQAYPRFLMEEFNGGNWCNPFFSTNNPVLNVSGDDLKNRYHTKIIIDHSAYDSVFQYVEKMIELSENTLEFLDPGVQEAYYYNESLRNDRNTQILRLIYKYLYNASSMIDLIESFDFTVFCNVKKYSGHEDDDDEEDNLRGRGEDSKESMGEEHDGAPDDSNDPIVPRKRAGSNLTFDYPVVLEFFQLKQELHDLISKIIMSTQSLTLEDPEVFKGLKDEDPLFYNREVLRIPKEKASLLLSNVLMDQVNNSKRNAISLNPDTLLSDYLNDGIQACQSVLGITQQLIEERETIINYATRVMQDNFDVQLLLVERNNTSSSDKTDDHSYYIGGHKKSSDVPWYLEGDDEYELLLDVKGNIKGGTKEALVSHLTHHLMFDSTFNSVFLLTFASMMSLGELIGLLIARFNVEAPEGLSYEEYNTWISKKQNPIRLRVMNIMKLLVEKHWSRSYYNEAILRKWLAFAEANQVQAFSVGKMLAVDLKKLLKGEIIYVERDPVVPNTKPPAPLTKLSSLLKKIKLLDIDYVELARQLTLREFKLYCKITKYACLAKVWGKKSGLHESIDSITQFIKASNQLTNFVGYMILRKAEPKKRVQVIRYFIQVADKCRQYNNFSSMTAIISALYSLPIHRLKKTWEYMNGDALSHLQNMNKLMNLSRNFNEYRDVLKFVGSEPCVPFFGVYLSDLTFVFHGNPDYLYNRTRQVNFAKRAKTAEIVAGIDRFKTTGYNFQEVPAVQGFLDQWFDKSPTIDEQYQISLTLEPRTGQRLTKT